LRETRPPELQLGEFKQRLRRDLMQEERRLQERRARRSGRALAAAAIGLACVVAVFVWRPSVPTAIHAYVAGTPPALAAARGYRAPALPVGGTVPAGYRPDDLRPVPASANASASSDWQWLDGWYEGQPQPSRVKALEDERIYAVRQFQLTDGRRIVVLSEIGGDPADEPAPEMSSIQDF